MPLSYLAVFIVAFLASLLGPLRGIGGGVIIKPVVDAMNVMPVATVSFLSSISVLTMSLARSPRMPWQRRRPSTSLMLLLARALPLAAWRVSSSSIASGQSRPCRAGRCCSGRGAYRAYGRRVCLYDKKVFHSGS